MMSTLNRIIGLLYMRLTRDCPTCWGYGTFDGVLYDSVEEMLAGSGRLEENLRLMTEAVRGQPWSAL